MDDELTWGVSVSEGVVAVLFGIAAVFWPGLTIVTLLYLFATFVLVSGLINLFSGIFHASSGVGSWFLRLLLSVIQIGVGIYLLRHPHVTFATFILLIGFTLIFRGVFEMVMAFMDDVRAGQRAMLLIAGLLAIVVGIIILFQPVSGGVAFVWVLGLYALVTGPIIIATAVSAHNASRKLAAKRA